MSVRDSVARRLTGGPPFRVVPDKMLVDLEVGDMVQDGTETIRDSDIVLEVESKLQTIGFEVERLERFGVLKITADRITTVVERLQDIGDQFSDITTERITKLRQRADSLDTATIVNRANALTQDYSISLDSDEEACFRRCLSDISLRNELTDIVASLDGVVDAEMLYTRTTMGPRSLRVEPEQLTSLLDDVLDDNSPDDLADMDDVVDLLDVGDVWEETRGEGVTIAIFDTAFCESQFDSERIVDTYNGDDVDSAFSDGDAEGHGSMSALAAAGNKEGGSPFDGIAPESDLILVRLTDEDGALSHTPEAMDWFAQKLEEIDGPVISNHSYGVPLCNGRAMDLCDSTSTKLVREVADMDNHISVYAAGNEANYCGHRLSGITNGITGANSISEVLAIGALRSDGSEAQTYSSHGYGACNSINDNPKPDVSAPIPQVLAYGCDVRDMSSRGGGSNGGTSTAAPITAGVCALLASHIGEADKDRIEEAIEETAKQPRKTQMNILRGFDARFGNGMVRPKEALEYLKDN